MENQSELLLYQTPDGVTKIETRLHDETVWLTQAQLCELFQKSKSTISEHIKHIFEEGELDELSTVRKFRTVQKEGNKDVEREIDYYNLDVIISVGYRVKSHRGTQFRIWATQRLLIKCTGQHMEILPQKLFTTGLMRQNRILV
jgi:hypothetical protein